MIFQVTNVFVANTKARASEINANFTDVLAILTAHHHDPNKYTGASPVTTSGIAPNAEIKDTQLHSPITRSGLINDSSLDTVGVDKGGIGMASAVAGDLIYADTTNHYSRLPIGSAGSSLQITGGGLPYWGATPIPALFGDGSDGSVVFDGSTTILGMAPGSSIYTMTRDIYCINITVNNGVTLKTNGYRVFATGTVTVGNGASGIIDASGGSATGVAGNGGGGGSGDPGAGGAGGTPGGVGGIAAYTGSPSLMAPPAGKDGVAGGAGCTGPSGGAATGTVGNNGISVTKGAGSNGVAGNTGGGGGNSSEPSGVGIAAGGGAGGSAGAIGTPLNLPHNAFAAYFMFDILGTAVQQIGGSAGSGSGGGGGGGGANGSSGNRTGGGGGGASGGSGAPGGIIAIFAQSIVVNAGGKIQALGGNGSNGGNGGNGNNDGSGKNSGGGGGGAGGPSGSGGIIMLIYINLTNSGTISVAAGTPGSGGTHGLGATGGGTPGSNGSDGPTGNTGNVGIIYQIVL